MQFITFNDEPVIIPDATAYFEVTGVLEMSIPMSPPCSLSAAAIRLVSISKATGIDFDETFDMNPPKEFSSPPSVIVRTGVSATLIFLILLCGFYSYKLHKRERRPEIPPKDEKTELHFAADIDCTKECRKIDGAELPVETS